MGRKKRKDRNLIPEHIHYFFEYGPEYLHQFEEWADLPWSLSFFLLHGVWLNRPWIVRKQWAELKSSGLLSGVDHRKWWAEKNINELRRANRHR